MRIRAGRRIGLVVGCVLSLLAVGWALDAAGSTSTAGALTPAAALALVLGFRHAFDADHVAAIDDSTRLFVQRGDRPVAIGFFFALGHSSVVLALSLLVAVAARSTAATSVESWHGVGGVVSATAAAVFLLVVGLLNLRVLRSVWRVRGDEHVDSAELARMMSSRGPVTRLMAGRAGRFTASWQLFFVGMVFGLGLETASEVALLGLSATAAAQGGVPVSAILALPLLFAGGMALFDTLNSLFMVYMYTSQIEVRQRLRFNIATTMVTAIVALTVATIYASVVLVDRFGVALLEPVAAVSDHFEVIGYVIVGGYLTLWIATLVSTRHSLSMPSATAIPATVSRPEV